MESDELVLAILAALPTHEVRGKKRLQKLAYLLKEAGVECVAEFDLRDYGPFSVEIAQAAEYLAILDYIDQEEISVGAPQRFMTVYKLNSENFNKNMLKNYEKTLNYIDKYDTISLEIAATIRFFESKGLDSKESIERTKEMKPNKTTPKVLVKSREILSHLEATE